MVLHGYVKQCKYKTNTFRWFYMKVLNSVNVKKCKFFWGEGGISKCFWGKAKQMAHWKKKKKKKPSKHALTIN